MNFGDATDEDTSFAIMDTAVGNGVNFFDSADVYGGPQSPDMAKGYGTSEEIIGRWLKKSGRRDDIVLATKAYQPMGLGPNDRRLSAYHLKRACEASLRRLQTDHIDLYQMHHVDRATPWEEIWQAMAQLITEGKITYVGSSNFAGWDVATAQQEAQSRHLLGLVSEQSLYNLADRAVEQELVPALNYYGICLIPWSPLASGLLAGSTAGADSLRRKAPHVEARAAALTVQLTEYHTLCDQLGHSPSDVALARLLHQPAVPAVISGPRTVEQLEVNLAVTSLAHDQRTLAELDRIWPGPGQAPESYAW
jgi:aryl-alcohol dehydrogenase-like predicted oxidoreductase